MNLRSVQRPILWMLLLLLSYLPAQGQRQMERLGRGIIAIRSSSSQVYVGWRLLGNDPEDIAFNLYRSANGGAAVKVNASPLASTTDYLDTPSSLSSVAYSYSVKPVLNGVEVPDVWANSGSGPATLPANAPVRQYFPVPLQATPDGGSTHKVKFCWVGDLDGDGEYDFVVDRYNSMETARQFVEAYKRDGTFLWRMNMGPNSTNHYNIEPGSSTIGIGHGDNMTVYDMDGDGRAEVIIRTANGVVFGNGSTVTAANDSLQFISIVDGMTGAEKARAPVPNPYLADGPVQGHIAILYVDGVRPSVLLAAKNRQGSGSFQGLTTVWDYREGQLTRRWTYDADTLGEHAPEGHQIRIADPDNDGKDEFLDIGYGIDDDGRQLFNVPEVVHGDRFHTADIDPDRPGLETYIIQQDNGSGLATALFDSGTGRTLKKWYAGGVVDVGRGLAADIDPAVKGLELFSTQPGLFDRKGNLLYNQRPFPPEAIWWDANLSREFLATVGGSAEAPAVARFNPAFPDGQSRIYTIYNETPPGTYWAYGGRPQFWGDILGDWREEIVCVANDNSELRIYSTKLKASSRLYTLMHNPQYRMQATTKGYVQGSYVDYYLGDEMTPPPPPPMVDARLVWKGGAGTSTWDIGATASWSSAQGSSAFQDGDTVRFDISGNNTTAVALSGTLQPGAVTVYSPKDYVFNGAGSLAGAMRLTKAGAGRLTLSGTHAYTGKTTIWDGALVVHGELQASAVTVWGGTWGGAEAGGTTGGRIGGTGRLGQLATLKYRGAVVPGAGMGNAGTLTFGAGLTAEDGAVLALDLSDDPTGANRASDRIAVLGDIRLSGTVTLVINALNGTLSPGTYTLATYTGSFVGNLSNLALKLPPGTAHTLSVGDGAIRLVIPTLRAPASIVWAGGVSGNRWDLAQTANWRRSGASDVFVSGDSVTFDSTGAANGTVSLTTQLPVAGVTVNASSNYSFIGTGAISGAGGLTKNGSGTLQISTLNEFTGPTVINAGVLAVETLNSGGEPSSIGAASTSPVNLVLNGGTLRLTGSQTNTNRGLTIGSSGGTLDVATAGSSMQISGAAIGNGTLTKSGPGTLILASANQYTGGTVIDGGTIYLAGATANSSGLGSGLVTINNGTLTMADVQASETAAWNLRVPANANARLNVDGRCTLTGTLTGSGALTYWAGYVRSDLRGNWSAFAGTINVIGDSDGGDFRILNTFGYGNAAIHLGEQMNAYYQPSMGSNLTMDIGALSGVATATLMGGPTSGRTFTWRIGGRNLDTEYAGVIGEQNTNSTTAIEKVGTGVWTLTGASSYRGATIVRAGALVVNGSLGTTNVTVRSGAALAGAGILGGPATIEGLLAPGDGVGTLTFGAGLVLRDTAVVKYTLGASASDRVAVSGSLTLAGVVEIDPGAGFGVGAYTLFTYTGSLASSGAGIAVAAMPDGYLGRMDLATSGLVKLVVSLSPFGEWQMSHFGSMTHAGAQRSADPDFDGQDNDSEFATGTDPKDAASSFVLNVEKTAGGRPVLSWPSVPGKSYAIEHTASLGEPWRPLATVPAAAAPAVRTTYVDETTANADQFYRVTVSQ